MANKKLKTIRFPGLSDSYTVPQVENGANNNVAVLDGAGNVKDSSIELSKVAKIDEVNELISGKLDANKLPEAINDALAQAKASGEFNGANGITPTIGANGNWYLDNTDTGKPSRGATGDTGPQGPKGDTGPAGKSAYASAQDGGFTGTEAQFNNGLSVMGDVSGIDTTVTQNSSNLITSGAVYTFAKAASSPGTPLFAQSVDELNASGDKTKIYLLPDGYLYAWAESTSQETVTISTPVNGTPDNPYKDGYRLGSSGDAFHNNVPGYTVTPYIDLTAYSGKNIRIILEGLTYFTETPTQWVQSRAYENSSTVR